VLPGSSRNSQSEPGQLDALATALLEQETLEEAEAYLVSGIERLSR
jgi:hypothetical protein